MVTGRKPAKPTGIDYSGLAFPKTTDFRERAKGKPKGKSGGFAAILAAPVNKALATFYATAPIPKGESRKKAKGRKDRAKLRTGRSVKALVFERERFQCVAYGVSPVCRRRPEDRHELIPKGRGGKVTTANCVPVCRPCHDAAQNQIGGLPLVFNWDGKANGKAPNADVPGAVWAVWKGIWKGVKPERRTA